MNTPLEKAKLIQSTHEALFSFAQNEADSEQHTLLKDIESSHPEYLYFALMDAHSTFGGGHDAPAFAVLRSHYGHIFKEIEQEQV